MRKEFSKWVEHRAVEQKNLIFLTGDLGYNALENLHAAIGERFVNVGVAEQNMISMAAAMAQQGLSPVCYSIAPFCVFRPAEQIRVDVCLHNLNVKIVGNGGGYGYGIMGATHHAIEDVAVLSSFQHMKCFIPFCNELVPAACDRMMDYQGPSYLRLGFGVCPETLRANLKYAPVQKLSSVDSPKLTIVGMGPVLLNALKASFKVNVPSDVFSINEMPLDELSNELIDSLEETKKLLVLEEHVSRGGLGEHLSLHLQKSGVALEQFIHRAALGYPNQSYGSQSYHQSVSGLDAESLSRVLGEFSV